MRLKHFECQTKKASEYDQEKHKHTPQTNPWHHGEEPQKSWPSEARGHKTPGKQFKQSNQLSFPHQTDCKIRRTQSTE